MAPAGCVGRPRRALPAVLGGDCGLAAPAPLPAGAVMPRAPFICQTAVDFSATPPGSATSVSRRQPPAHIPSCLAQR